jgi:hypothetical protein
VVPIFQARWHERAEINKLKFIYNEMVGQRKEDLVLFMSGEKY